MIPSRRIVRLLYRLNRLHDGIGLKRLRGLAKEGGGNDRADDFGGSLLHVIDWGGYRLAIRVFGAVRKQSAHVSW
jgi:hypothetical protein